MDSTLPITLLPILQAQQDALTQQSNTLESAGRADEANLKKAGRNIYGIFSQLAQKGLSKEALSAQHAKLEAAWQLALNTATAHNDYAQVAVEETKLAALADIYKIITGISEESPGREDAHG